MTNSAAGFKTLIPAQPDRGVGVMPTIDTDRSGGPNDGRIYLAYSDLGAGGAADFDVLVRSSSDGGVTWSAPVVVHDDGGTNSQFLPWVDVDQQTGQVVAVWYDARNDANNKQVEVFLAASSDGGATWAANILVSDNPSDMSVDNPSRYLGNFLEDIGVASLGGMAFPVWADNSESGGDLDYYTDQVSIAFDALPVCDANGPYTAECGLPKLLDGSASKDPDGGVLTFDWSGPFAGSPLLGGGPKPSVTFVSPTGAKAVGLTVTDDEGNPVACSSNVNVIDTIAPDLTVPADVTAECASPNGTAVDIGDAIVGDFCDKNIVATNNAPALFPPGSTNVTWTATDDDGNQSGAVQSVLIEDTTPPVIDCGAPATITPSDAPIAFTATASDVCEGPLQPVIVDYARTGLVERQPTVVACAAAYLVGVGLVGTGMILERIARVRLEVTRLLYLSTPGARRTLVAPAGSPPEVP